MAAHWYCLIGLKQYGPFTGEQIQQLVQQGQLQREHGVRTETDSEWTAAGDLPGLFPALQAAPAPPTAPTVTTKPKRMPIAPGVSVPPYPQPATPAVPSATPVRPPKSAVPAADPAVAAPVAMPVQVAPVTAAPVASAPATAIPVAAAPVALAAVPAAASRAQGGAAQVRPVSAARPLPLHPVLPPAPPAGTALATGFEEAKSRRRHASRKKSQMLVGGLGAAMLLLIVVAAVVTTSRSGSESGRTTESSKGASGDPEIETGGVSAANAVSADPADPVPPIAPAAKAAVPEAKVAALPDVSRWLEATRQKGGIKNVVRLGVGNAWLDSVDGKPAILNVEIEITNLSPDTPLDFAGWRPEVQPQTEWRAVMADDAQTLLAAAPPRAAAHRRAARRRIAPGQSVIEQLSFLLPEGDSKQFRLALPYAALGQMGYLGFELPKQMIKDKPPGAEEPASKEPARVASETLPSAAGAIKPQPGEPKTLGDLRTEIERNGEGRMEFMTDPSEPLAEEPPPNEPEKIPDIRKLIEEEDPTMESTNEAQPSEESPTTAPKSP